MAEAIQINSTLYAGDSAAQIISLAVTGSDTVEKGLVRVETGIQKNRQIKKLDVSSFMQKRKATPISKGNVVIDHRNLTPQDMMVYIEMNPRDFEADWLADEQYRQNPELLNRQLPATVESQLMVQLMKRVNEFFEKQYWIGRIEFDVEGSAVDPTTKGLLAGDAQYSYFDGFIKKWLTASGTIAVGSPSAITVANIRDKFKSALLLLPTALKFKYGSNGVKFLCSYVDVEKYQTALTDDTYKNNNSTEVAILRYQGYEIVPVAGLPENTFFLCFANSGINSNLYLGMNDTKDMTVQMDKVQANSELYFVKALFKMDVNFGFAEEMVVHTLITN